LEKKRNRFYLEVGGWGAGWWRGVAQAMYIHVSKCKNDKIKEKKKNIVAQHQVDQWEEEGMEITLFKKIIQYRIQWEMKKIDTHLQTPIK
jgi:hypothetical protein